jgi:hypothetical protein
MTTEDLLAGVKSLASATALIASWPAPLAAFVGALLDLGGDVLQAATHAGEADPVRILQTLRRDLRASVSADWQTELDKGG